VTFKGRAVVLDQPNGTFSIVEQVLPDVDPGGMIVKQEMCGVCGTDAHNYRGHAPTLKYPIVMGHENVGIVAQLGRNAEKVDVTDRPVREGDRVYVIPGIRCGKCYYCKVLQQPNLCPNGGGIGFRPYPDQPIEVQGGYADYIWMKAGQGCLRVDIEPRNICALEPISIGVHVASQYHFQPGETVVVQGAGAVGLGTVAAAKEMGAAKIIVIGAPAGRLELAKQFGADVTIDLSEVKSVEERVAMVQKLSVGGYGADVVFECTGFPGAIVEGIDMMRRGGTYIVAGHFTDAGPLTLNPFVHLNRKAVTLKGVWSSEPLHFVRARAIVESGKYPIDQLVSHVLPLERLGDAIQAMTSGKYMLDGKEVRKIGVSAAL
jgi:L-iditol 2-dehydrogenase